MFPTKKNILPKSKPKNKTIVKKVKKEKSKTSALIPKEKPIQKKEVVSSNLIKEKVDGIITDYPDSLLVVMREMNIHIKKN